jgi:hypothetical protein
MLDPLRLNLLSFLLTVAVIVEEAMVNERRT